MILPNTGEYLGKWFVLTLGNGWFRNHLSLQMLTADSDPPGPTRNAKVYVQPDRNPAIAFC